MKRLLLAIFALCLLALPAAADPPDRLAWYTGGQELQGFEVGGAPLSLEFVACSNTTTDGTTTTYSSHSVGTAGNRKTIVAIMSELPSTNHWSSVTVGGAAAEEIASFSSGGASSSDDTAFYIVDNPAGTAEDIVVTASGSATTNAICVWALYNSDYSFPTNAKIRGANSDDLDIDTRSNYVILAATRNATSGTSHTWSGLTERADTSNGEFTFTAADGSGAAATDNVDISITPSAGVAGRNVVIAFSNDHSTPVAYPTGCSVTNTDLTTYSFTDATVGIPHSSRVTVVGLTAEDSATTFNFGAATIGGDTATEVLETGAGGLVEAALDVLANPLDDQETIAVTMSEAITGNASACVWAVYHLNSSTANDSAAATTTSGAAMSANVNTDANGIAVAVCGSHPDGSVDTFTWIGLDRGQYTTGSESSVTGGDEDQTASAAPRSISCDPSDATADAAIVAGSWD